MRRGRVGEGLWESEVGMNFENIDWPMQFAAWGTFVLIGLALLSLIYLVSRAANRDANKPQNHPRRRYEPPQHQAYIPPSIQRDDFDIQS